MTNVIPFERKPKQRRIKYTIESPEFEAKIARIKISLERINELMGECRNKTTKESDHE